MNFRCVEGSHPSTRWARSIKRKKVREEKQKKKKNEKGGQGKTLHEDDELLWLHSDEGEVSKDHLNVTEIVGWGQGSQQGELKGRRR